MGDTEYYTALANPVLRRHEDGQRRGTAAQWAAGDPILARGEQGEEVDTGIIKVGDGTTRYSLLPAMLTQAVANATYAPLVGSVPAAVTGLTSSTASALRASLRSARSGTKVRLAHIGDSISYGYYINSVGSPSGSLMSSGNLVSVMTDYLFTRGGIPTYQGMSNAGSISVFNATLKRPYWTKGTGWSAQAGYGIAGSENGTAGGAASAAGTLDFGPITCDGFIVKWMRRASTSTFDLTVDSGSATSTGGTGSDSVQFTTISAGSLGSHTLHIGNIGAGAQGAIILGVEPTVSTGGLHVANYAGPGATAAAWTSASSVWNPLPVVFDADQPAISIFGLGTNDYLAASNRTPTQLQADMTTLFTKAQTYGTALCWIEPQRGDTGSVNTSFTWAQYVAAIKAAAVAKNVPVLDFGTYLGGTVATASNGALDAGDTVHPNAQGQYLIGRGLAEFLLSV